MLDAWDDFDSTIADARVAEVFAKAVFDMDEIKLEDPWDLNSNARLNTDWPSEETAHKHSFQSLSFTYLDIRLLAVRPRRLRRRKRITLWMVTTRSASTVSRFMTSLRVTLGPQIISTPASNPRRATCRTWDDDNNGLTECSLDFIVV
jgi:hypothetical protein